MKHIVVDLEMNIIPKKEAARKICRNEIIEIGAVMLDENHHEISAFRTYVKPEHNAVIDATIRHLTGITTEMVASAPKFKEAFRMFTAWCLGTGDEVEICAWSDSDYNQVEKEMLLKEYVPTEEERCITDVAWKDFQKEFDCNLGFERQVSLAMALDMAGIDFTGRQHDALDDARNTAELFTIYHNPSLFCATLQKIKEAMTPSNAGASLGNLFDFSALGLPA